MFWHIFDKKNFKRLVKKMKKIQIQLAINYFLADSSNTVKSDLGQYPICDTIFKNFTNYICCRKVTISVKKNQQIRTKYFKNNNKLN